MTDVLTDAAAAEIAAWMGLRPEGRSLRLVGPADAVRSGKRDASASSHRLRDSSSR